MRQNKRLIILIKVKCNAKNVVFNYLFVAEANSDCVGVDSLDNNNGAFPSFPSESILNSAFPYIFLSWQRKEEEKIKMLVRQKPWMEIPAR